MFAVIRTGGKQYKVGPGDYIRTEKLTGEKGSLLEFSSVLLLSQDDKVETDSTRLQHVKVIGKIVEQGRARKIIVFKYKRRKNYRRRQGHRQWFTGIIIQQILVNGEAGNNTTPAKSEGGESDGA